MDAGAATPRVPIYCHHRVGEAVAEKWTAVAEKTHGSQTQAAHGCHGKDYAGKCSTAVAEKRTAVAEKRNRRRGKKAKGVQRLESL